MRVLASLGLVLLLAPVGPVRALGSPRAPAKAGESPSPVLEEVSRLRQRWPGHLGQTQRPDDPRPAAASPQAPAPAVPARRRRRDPRFGEGTRPSRVPIPLPHWEGFVGVGRYTPVSQALRGALVLTPLVFGARYLTSDAELNAYEALGYEVSVMGLEVGPQRLWAADIGGLIYTHSRSFLSVENHFFFGAGVGNITIETSTLASTQVPYYFVAAGLRLRAGELYVDGLFKRLQHFTEERVRATGLLSTVQVSYPFWR